MNVLISKIPGILFAGIYSVVVFLIVVAFISTNHHLTLSGNKNEWFAFIFLLFTFGYIKHKIGYYTSLDSAYCKQTSICEKAARSQHPSYFEKLKAFIGFETNMWLEAVGEGCVFVFVGIPVFLFVRQQLLAAFLTGISAHLISGYTGINESFCRTSCSLLFL